LVSYLSIKAKNWWEERKFRRAFPDPGFQAIDQDLSFRYLWQNPYELSKRFLQKRGEIEVHQYGETPLLTMDLIAQKAKLSSKDHLYELGSGRGRTSFFLHYFYGCRVTGIEWIPKFVEKGNAIARKHYLLDVVFRNANFLYTDLSEATIIYLYGTMLPDSRVFQLCKKIPKGIKVVSVSYPLSDYDPKFQVTEQFTASFPWGKGEVYVNT
jgi:SAM-dependent methyltransferase